MSIAQSLGQALGMGLQQGTQTGLQALMKNYFNQQKLEQIDKTPFTTQDLKNKILIGDLGKSYSPEQQFKLLDKLNERVKKIGRTNSLNEFGQNPLEYLSEAPKELEETINEKIKKPLSEKKGGLLDFIMGTAEPRGIGEVIKEKPSEIGGIPTRGWLDFIAESLGQKPLSMRLQPTEAGAIQVQQTPTEVWRELIEEGLSEDAKKAIRQGEFAAIILPDVIGGLAKLAPKEGLKLAEDVIKANKYPQETINRIKDITKEFKGTKIEVPKGLSKGELEAKRITGKEKAKEFAKRPLEKYTKERPKYESPQMKAEKLRASKELINIDDKIKTTEENLLKINKALEGQKSTNKTFDPIRKSKENFEKQLTDLKEQRKTQEYISKRGKEPFSYEKTLEEANKHNKNIKFAYENPLSKEAQELTRQFTRDQKYVDEALNILKNRKETPIAPFEDFYQKKLKTYNDSYRKMISDLDKQINESIGQSKKNLEGLRDKFKTNLNINESKLLKHADKLRTLKDIEKSNALIKHDLAILRNDIPKFEKDLIKYKDSIKTPLEEKITKATKDKFVKDFSKSFEEFLNNPTKENFTEKVEKIIKDTTKEKITSEQFAKMSNKAKKTYSKKFNTLKGIGIGAIKEYIKAKLGLNIPTRGLPKVLGKKVGAGAATGILLTTFAVNAYKNLKKHVIVRNFKKVLATKNPRKIFEYRNKLKSKGFTDQKINNLQKLAER